MNTESIDIKKVKFGEIKQVGDFTFDDTFTYIYILLPGSVNIDAIQIQQGSSNGNKIWGWNGDKEKPTLTPSIHVLNQWHEFLTNGRLISC